MDHRAAYQLADDWLAAWNSHDLEQILEHYHPDVRFSSPVVRRLGVDPTGTVTGRAALASYFDRALAAADVLRFKPVATLTGVSGLTIAYRNHRSQLVAETMLVEGGLVRTAHVHYAPAGEQP